ncbi:hypothetical protein [Nonomuraea sp. NPDC050310]|uniref:hypothetical protein n=1 Tax=Nonomuraea sp. NPDC050310 TaxID=3154935 RepID=UPI0033F6E82F
MPTHSLLDHGGEPVLCPACEGVRPASRPEGYTLARARLIVAHGFCTEPHLDTSDGETDHTTASQPEAGSEQACGENQDSSALNLICRSTARSGVDDIQAIQAPNPEALPAKPARRS